MDNTAKQEVQLGQAPADQPQIDLGKPTIPPTSFQTANHRADLWKYSDVTDKDHQQLTNELMSGKESSARQEAANANNVKKIKAVQKDPPKDIQQLFNAYTPTDPSWFPEHAIANKFMLNLPNSVDKFSGSDWAQFYKKQPEEEAYLRRSGTGVGSILQILDTYHKDVQDKLNSKSTLGTIYTTFRDDFALPVLANIRETGQPLFTASALAREQEKLFGLPPSQAKAYLEDKKNSMPDEQWNDYLGYMKDYHSAADIFTRNALSILDVAGQPGTLAGIRVGASMIKGMERLGKSTAVGAAATATGDIETAAVKAATQEILPQVSAKGFVFDITKEKDKLEESFFSGMNKRREDRFESGLWLDRELVNRLKERSQVFGDKLKNILNTVRNVSRTDLEESAEKLMKGMAELARNEGWDKGPNSMLLDMGKPIYYNLLDRYLAPFALGRPDGTLFRKEWEALAFAHEHGIEATAQFRAAPTKKELAAASWEGRTIPKGAGWWLQVLKPIKEDSDVFRDVLKLNEANEYQEGWLSHFFDYFRTPDEMLSKEDNLARKTAVYSGGYLVPLIRERAQELRDLGWGRKNIKALEDVLRRTQFMKDPSLLDPRPGYFPQTPREVEDIWQDVNKRWPTELELKAYYTVLDMYEADYQLRNLAIQRMLHRLGAEQLSIHAGDYKSHYINVIKEDKIPTTGNVLLAHQSVRPSTFDMKRWNQIVFKERSKLKEAMKNDGVSIYRVVHPTSGPVSGVGPVNDEVIHHIVVKNKDIKTLAPNQMPYRGGIHVMPEYNKYVKTAQVIYDKLGKVSRYVGDTIHHGVTNGAKGEAWAKLANQALAARKAGDRVLEESLVPKLGYDLANWDSKFKPTRGRDGKLNHPTLNVDHPFFVLDSGVKVIDSVHGGYLRDNNLIKDSYREGDPYLQHVVEFSQMRDAEDFTSIRDGGSRYNPSFSLQPAEYLNPIDSLARGLTRIARSTSFDSLKIQGMENWLAQGIKAGVFGLKPKDIYAAPLAFFSNPKWATGITREAKAQYESVWMALRSMNGLYSDVDRWTSSWAQKFNNMLYKASPKLDDVLNTWQLGGTRDPLRFARSIAVHTSMGFFNVGQLLLHFSAFYNGTLIAGARPARAGSIGLLLSMWATINNDPKILAHLDSLAVKMGGFKPGDWLESHGGLIRSGFWQEAGSHVLNPALLANEIVPTLKHTILNAGMLPFRWGVQGLRAASWHMAFHEAKYGEKMVPGGRLSKLSDKDWGWVTNRADLHSHNMTRASSSALEQNALFATAFQFTTYFRRLAEITMGKRLTTPERLRLIAGNAIMYGVPITSGMAMLPFADLMRKEAIQAGFPMGQNQAVDFFNYGLPTFLSIYALGYPLDISEKYGPKSPFEALIQDPTMWDLGFGAVGSKWESLFHAFSPFMGAILSMLPGSTEENRWPITGADVWGVAREISAINAGYEGWNILKTGQWVTKRGRDVEADIPGWAGIVMAATGVRSLGQHEMYLMQNIKDSDKKYQQTVLSNALEHWNKATRALEQHNYSEADAEMKKFEAHFVFMNHETIQEAIKAGAKAGTDQLTQVKQDYWSIRRKPTGEQ